MTRGIVFVAFIMLLVSFFTSTVLAGESNNVILLEKKGVVIEIPASAMNSCDTCSALILSTEQLTRLSENLTSKLLKEGWVKVEKTASTKKLTVCWKNYDDRLSYEFKDSPQGLSAMIVPVGTNRLSEEILAYANR